MLGLVAAFICLTSLLTYVNFRFIGLPPTIGVMVTALMFSLLMQGLSFLGYPGLEGRVQELIGQIDFGDLRYSTGFGIAWISPLGPLKFSIAFPLNDKEGDDTQRFQFQIGTGF